MELRTKYSTWLPRWPGDPVNRYRFGLIALCAGIWVYGMAYMVVELSRNM